MYFYPAKRPVTKYRCIVMQTKTSVQQVKVHALHTPRVRTQLEVTLVYAILDTRCKDQHVSVSYLFNPYFIFIFIYHKVINNNNKLVVINSTINAVTRIYRVVQKNGSLVLNFQ